MKLENKVIWLTGASQGIGYELAKQLFDRNNTLIVTARHTETLEELASHFPHEKIIIKSGDVSKREANERIVSEIKHEFAVIDTMILNAGTCVYIDADDFSSEKFIHNIQTNLISASYAIEFALPLLKQSLQPHIIAIASSAAYLPLPRASGYGASKAALAYMMESLAVELSQQGITLSTVYPGFVKTPLTDKNDFPMPFRITASNAAKRILQACDKGKAHVHFPKRFTLPLKIIGALPYTIRQWLATKTVR